MQLYMTGRKKASATANIPAIQILPHPKKHLQQRISQSCRYHSIPKKHLQQRISKPCRYHRILKSICDSEYPSHADTTTLPQKYQATMQSGELESGLPDEAEQESIVAWYLVQFRRSLPEQATQPPEAKPHNRLSPPASCTNKKTINFSGRGVDIGISKFYN